MTARHLLISFALGLGLALTLLWVLGGALLPAVHATAVQHPDQRPPLHPGDVITVCPEVAGTCAYTNVQAAVDAANDGDIIKVAAGAYTGVNVRPRNDVTTTGVVTQVVYISKTVIIRGGYTTAFTDPPDPEANPTALDAQGQGRVLYITGDISPTVEGLHITGGDATGLGGDAWGSDSGGGVYVVTATAIFRDNWVFGNSAEYGGGLYLFASEATFSESSIISNTASCGGGGLHLGHSNATLSDNAVHGNHACRGGGMRLDESDAILRNNTVSDNDAYEGGGLYLEDSAATVSGNTISVNIASTGGGLHLDHSDAMLSGNDVISNISYDYGGGLYLDHSDAALDGNTVISNTSYRYSGGVCLVDSDAVLSDNTIAANTAREAGGGLYLANSNATLNGNAIVANAADSIGGGLSLVESHPTLTNNTIAENRADSSGGGLSLCYSSATLSGDTITSNTSNYSGGGLYLIGYSAITLTNTVVADNQVNTTGSGVYMSRSSARLLHTTIARNRGGDGSGIYVTDRGSRYGAVMLTNTILVSHTVGITVTTGSTATLEATLWGIDTWANTADWGGDGTVITGTPDHNYWGDPAFVDPDGGDYHIGPESAAVDAGVDAEVITDMDGDPRTDGHPDLGADELGSALLVTKQAYPDLVQPGAQLTYTIRITNTGGVTFTAIVTDTLPDNITPGETSGGTLILPGGVITWTPVSIAPGDVWMETFVVTVEVDYTGLLTNVVWVTTEEGATGVYTQTSTAGIAPPNQAPYRPSNPIPAGGATDVPITQTLSWQGGDPDGDPVTYTIAFGNSDPPPFATTTVLTSYTPSLITDTIYYWVITATDGISTVVGPVWHFTTVGFKYVYLPLVLRQYQ